MFSIRLLFVLSLSAFSVAACGAYSENLSYSHYMVQAQPGQSLLDAIKAVSPFKHADGSISHGHTEAKVSWSFDMREFKDSTCAIAHVRVHLAALITLPELRSGIASQQREFSPYIAALRRHEQGHFQLSQASAKEIEHSLSQLSKRRSCKALEAEANQIGNVLMNTSAELNAEYDRRTEHGATQGARLSH